jgi:hypothetical protein
MSPVFRNPIMASVIGLQSLSRSVPRMWSDQLSSFPLSRYVTGACRDGKKLHDASARSSKSVTLPVLTEQDGQECRLGV